MPCAGLLLPTFLTADLHLVITDRYIFTDQLYCSSLFLERASGRTHTHTHTPLIVLRADSGVPAKCVQFSDSPRPPLSFSVGEVHEQEVADKCRVRAGLPSQGGISLKAIVLCCGEEKRDCVGTGSECSQSAVEGTAFMGPPLPLLPPVPFCGSGSDCRHIPGLYPVEWWALVHCMTKTAWG